MTALGEIDTKRTYTALEYLALPDTDKDYELVNGKLVETALPSLIHGTVISSLAWQFGNFLEAQPLGQSVVGTTFVLNTTDVYRPDLAFVLTNRLDGLDYLDGFPGAPDLAVEVLTTLDTFFNLDEKIAGYLSADTKLVWVINPRRRTVEVFRPGTLKPQVLDVTEDLDGESLLPGFKLRVSGLFD